MKHLAIAGLFLAIASSGYPRRLTQASKSQTQSLPFTVTQITTLSLP